MSFTLIKQNNKLKNKKNVKKDTKYFNEKKDLKKKYYKNIKKYYNDIKKLDEDIKNKYYEYDPNAITNDDDDGKINISKDVLSNNYCETTKFDTSSSSINYLEC